ncbi:MAG: flagellar export chaperone FlgN [Candidatus Acidiferrum sp.]
MKSETERYLELLDRRIGLLGTLAESLVQVRTDIVCLDVNGLEARISQQEQLCRQVGALDGQLDKLQEQCATSLRASALAGNAGVPGGKEREMLAKQPSTQLEETRERMKSAQGRVKQLNASHQELLRRCRRTTNALLNSYATFANTYADPWRAGRALLGSSHENSRERI